MRKHRLLDDERIPGSKEAPARPGVYMLFWNDLCVYVGASRDLRNRLMSHPLRGLCNSFTFIECEMRDLKRTEQAQMDALSPTLNRQKAYAPPRRTPWERANGWAA